MTVCLFGNYIKNYPRVQVLRQGLKENSVEVLECQTRQRGLKKYLELYQQHKKIKNKYNILIVMMGGQTLVWLAKLLSTKKIIFDAFTSLYLTNIEDRKNCSAKSFKAWHYKFLDWLPCKLADKVLLDTYAQIDYFSQNYKIKKNEFIKLPTSADDKIFYPQKAEKKDNKFIVHWHGHIVPFHSVATIIQAAKILKNKLDIEFQIITRFNSQYEEIKKLTDDLKLQNIKFYPETDYKGLAKYINQADVCLGVFGNNKKAQVVIPNKIIEATACAKPVITGRQEVLSELFIGKENILMINPQDPQDLADKIWELENNSELRQRISNKAYQLYLNTRPKFIVKNLLKKI